MRKRGSPFSSADAEFHQPERLGERSQACINRIDLHYKVMQRSIVALVIAAALSSGCGNAATRRAAAGARQGQIQNLDNSNLP